LPIPEDQREMFRRSLGGVHVFHLCDIHSWVDVDASSDRYDPIIAIS